MTASTPIARVAAFAVAAAHRRPGTIGIDRVTRNGQSHDLTLDDLNAVLAALADACDDHEACESCGAALCETCGLGTIADCPADRVHCGGNAAWCWDQACMDAARDDHATEIAEDIELERCET